MHGTRPRNGATLSLVTVGVPNHAKSKSSATPALRARLAKLARLGSLGITARLLVSLTSVAILAATANLVVENGVSVIRLVTHPEPPQAPIPVESPRPAEAPRPLVRDPTRLVAALGEFDQAVRLVVESGGDATTTYDRAFAVLAAAAHSYADGPGASAADASAARDAALAHSRDSRRLVQVTRDHRDAIADYSVNLTAMGTRVQTSIDRAWKIMGRVVARQSLIKLSAQLDVVRSTFARRDASASASSLATRLAPAELAFATSLQQNADALRRSQGGEWLDDMRANLAHLEAARLRMAQAETRRARLATAYFSESDRLIRSLSAASKNAAPAPVRPAASRPASAPVPAIIKREPIAAEPPTPSIARRSLVATLSLVVLALLTWISIVTILGVLRQVRRLTGATRQLARGEPIKPIVPGGIRELDAIGVAIDSMARQLAVAQLANADAQRRLEGTVAERTRDLKDLAEKDPLTGLPNRRQLFASLSAAIEHAKTWKCQLGVFYLDVDNFKILNDSMGHVFGDRVLIEIGRRLESVALPFGFAGRLGGDEFMIVQEEAGSVEEIRSAGNAIVHAFEKAIEVEGREIIVSVSVGASVYPDHETSEESLLRAADAALFSAKELGRSRLSMFTPELLARVSAKFAMEQRLRRAIEKQEFELFYQPEVNLQTLEVSLVEALLRWRMPDGTYQCPGEFLSVAEEFGLLAEIDEWVMNAAVEAVAQWRRGPWPDARIAINVSPRQLLDQRFVGKLRELLARCAVPADCLELELTESVLQTGPATIKALTDLRALGVAIALDDFGTGYSSLASLEQLPLTRVKLDRSLIARIDTSARSASIARATLVLCAELGLEVTAEGVERVEQFSALLEFGALSLQGYLLAYPLPASQLMPAIRRLPARCQELVLSCGPVGKSRVSVAAEAGLFASAAAD